MAEVELKFEVPPESHAAFRRLAPLRAVKPTTAHLKAIYFDTPAFELRDREMALRLRRTGRRWVQCLKAGESGTGGLHARQEWEFNRPDATLDLSLFKNFPALDASLAEVFEVDVRRTTWRLEPSPGNRIEVALDRGAVIRAGRQEPVSEIEIESVSGDPEAIFDFAERLLELAPMRPSATTKAARGYRLARGERAAPAKARAATLDEAMTPPAAARAIVRAALDQLLANDAGLLAQIDPEYLHQLRVAVRRLRSALLVFGKVLAADFVAQAREELRWLSQAAGPARDWDVLATQTLPPLLEGYGDASAARSVRLRIAARRKIAREVVRDALRSARYSHLVLILARWLSSTSPEESSDPVTLHDYASRVLRKRHRQLLAGARKLSILTPEERHELRLEAKKLRYSTEGFATLFKRKQVASYLETLSDIQEDLGRANDAAVAARLLAEVKVPAGFAQFARGWLAAQTQASVADLGRHGERLGTAKSFWEAA